MAGTVAARWAQWERKGGRTASALGGASLPDTFPTTDLRQRTMIALTPDYTLPWWEWGWADITPYVRWEPGITFAYGRRDETTDVATLSGDMLLTNTDGRFSRNNPFGAYAGQLTRGTPIWSQVNPGSGWYTILQAYVLAWPKRWDSTGEDATVPISLGGIIRMLQRTDLQRTPLERTVLAADPIAAWMLGDGNGATLGGSAVAEGLPMRVTVGEPVFGTGEDIPAGLGGSVTILDGASMSGVVNGCSAAAWSFEFCASALEQVEGALATLRIGSGDYERIDILGSFGGSQLAYFVYRDGTGAQNASWSTTDFDGTWYHYLITAQQVGANIQVRIYANGTEVASPLIAVDTLGEIIRVDLNSTQYLGPIDAMSVSTAAVHNGVLTAAQAAGRYQAMLAYVREQAHVRAARVCDEVNIPFFCVGAASAELGAQPTGTDLEVLRDTEAADAGSALYEHEFGFGYKTVREYMRQPEALSLDQAQGELAEQIQADDDDANYRNQFTATRTDGASATVRDPDYVTGARLVTASGIYNVNTDEQVPHIAGFEMYRGLSDDDRWPQVSINLANHPELIGAVTGLRFGDRFVVENPYSQAAVDRIDVFFEGASVHVNSRQWEVTSNASPARLLNEVGVWGASYAAAETRWGARLSTVATAISDVATSVTVSAPGETWVTGNTVSNPDAFPLNVDIGGITYECTEITGSVPTFTFTITRLGTDRAHDAGTRVEPTDTGRWGI